MVPRPFRRSVLLVILLMLAAVRGTPAQRPVAPALALPPAAERPVDFAGDIKPILQTSCARCHARGHAKGGFSLETRDALLRGGDNGPAVVPGRSDESYLVMLVAGLEKGMLMPQKGARLTAGQIGLLRAWIDQGLPWDPAVTFAKPPPRNLTPRRPGLPAAGVADANPVDRLLLPYFAQHGVDPAPVIGDRQFARRVFLDVVGLLPAPRELDAFVADARPDKRQRLVRRLLADNRRFAEHWLTFWNDLLRNAYRGTGYIDGGRESITAWLYAALADNLPYDQFVARLVNPADRARGFIKGIVWRGVVNASQTPQMQAAQNVSQVFLGVNLKCASCHDSFINDWQLADAYGLAGVFAEGPLEMVECDRPTGATAPLKLPYPELGRVDPGAPRDARLAQLADALTGRSNGRLSRTIVNRLWARFMGRGLVEPMDDMEQPAWNDDLLDWLAEDLVDHDYDLKFTMTRILTSRAYQRPAIDDAGGSDAFVFRGPAIRRMSAEQFVDALSAITGVWQAAPDKAFDFTLVSSHEPTAPARVRAALVPADPLMTALGRPNREQVVTVRQNDATTLQGLELANGATLATRLRHGARRLLASHPGAREVTEVIYRRALGRAPTPAEREACLGLLGRRPTVAGVEDLLWSVVMLPEFQLVH